MKAVIDAVFQKAESEIGRYRIGMYLFLTLWKIDLGILRKAFSKVEDTFVYLSSDEESVVDTLIITLMALQERDSAMYRRGLKMIRNSFLKKIEPRVEELKGSFRKKLIEADSSAWEFKGTDYRIVQISPLYPKGIEEYLQTLGEPLFPTMPYRSRQYQQEQKSESNSVDSESEKEDERYGYVRRIQNNGSNVKVKDKLRERSATNRSNSQQHRGKQVVNSRDLSKSRSTSKGMDNNTKTEGKNSIRIKGDKEIMKDGSRSGSKGHIQYKEQPNRLQHHDSELRRSYGHQDSLSGLISAPLAASKSKSKGKSKDNIQTEKKKKRGMVPLSPEEDSLNNGATRVPRHKNPIGIEELSDPRLNRDFLRSGHLGSEEDLLNEDIRQVLAGTGKLIPSKREPPPRLYNKGIIVLIEDLILGAEKGDLIKLHVYLSSEFYKEPKRMELLDNIMDVCMYYLHFENTPFEPHVRLVLQTLGEYLRRNICLCKTQIC